MVDIDSPDGLDHSKRIAIVGGGLSGILMAIQLKRKLNHHNFVIYEQESELGGTWWRNSYPNCGCDIPTLMYSYSFAQNPEWSSLFAGQAEIHAYIRRTAEKYDILKHIQYNKRVIEGKWIEEESKWVCTIQDTKTGEITQDKGEIGVSAIGGLSVPNKCDIPGVEKFKGHMFHSAKWDHSVSLKDKNVIVIGNGCSAAQFVPVIAKDAKHLYQCIRSAQWIMPMRNPKFGPILHWMFNWIPGFQRFLRFWLYFFLDTSFYAFTKAGTWRRNLDERLFKRSMQKLIPKKYWDIAIPKFKFGCKRRVIDHNGAYQKTLHRENFTLTNEPILRIEADYVVLKNGEKIYADVIILANGFQVTRPFAGTKIIGRNGISLDDHWKNTGGIQSYFSTLVADIPNFFIMMGPNSASGHMSVVYTSENQVNFALRCLRPLLENKIKALEVTQDAENAQCQWIQEKTQSTVWGPSGGCNSYYIDQETKRNVATYPDYQTMFWWRTLSVAWKDFNLKDFATEKWGNGKSFDLSSYLLK